MRITLAVMLTLVLGSTAFAQETGLAATELTERVVPAPNAAPVDASIGSGVVTLVAFLGLIGGLLAHWSRDTSCGDDRSVFRSDG